MIDEKPPSLFWTRMALLAVAFTLTSIGILFVHSTMSATGEAFPCRAARGQILKGIAALVGCVIVSRIDYRILGRFSPLFYIGMIGVLSYMLLTKSADVKTARWIDLRFMKIQPSELMKISVILTLAYYFRFRENHRRLWGLILPAALIFLPMILVARQPDLGTSLMLPPILFAMLFVAGAKLWPLVSTLVIGLAALPIVYLLRNVLPLLLPYQMRRIEVLFEQSDLASFESASRDQAYQLFQSLLALGSGGITGLGYGQGEQNRLDWLPERQTDFIFSIIGEEMGFVGAAFVIALFVLLIALCLRVALSTREPFGRLIATGVCVAFAAQSIQNLGMTMGLLPITGLPLPFVSFGGSSLVSSFVSLGLVVGVAARPVRVVATADLSPLDAPRRVAISRHQGGGRLEPG